MSLFIDESVIKIEISENDYVEVKKELSYETMFLFTQAQSDSSKITEVMKEAIVKIVSEGKEIEITIENIKKLKVNIMNQIMLKLTESLNESTEEVKKN